MRCSIIPVLVLFALLGSYAWAGTTQTETGKIYLRNAPRTKPAYLFKKNVSTNSAWRHVRTEYRSPSGELLVEESYQYENGKLARYVYNQLQMKEGGFINIRDKKVKFEFTKEGKTNSDEEDEPDDIMIADLIGPFIQKNWVALHDKEDTVHTRYLVLERQDTFGFKFFMDGERPCEKNTCVRIMMKPSSIFISALVEPISILVEKNAPHAVKEIDGRLPIRIPEVPNPKSRKDYRALDAILVLE